MWIYKEYFDKEDPPKKDPPPPKKKIYLLYGLSGAGKTELCRVLIDHSFKGGDHEATDHPDIYKGENFALTDCTGSNPRLNNDFVKTKATDYDEHILVYVFSAVAYLKEQEIATKIKVQIGACTKMADDLNAHKVFVLGTHSAHSPNKQYPNYVPSSSEHSRIIQDLQGLAPMRIFELKDKPYTEIETFLEISWVSMPTCKMQSKNS